MDLEELFPKNLYHSYIIEGDPIQTAPLLLEFLENRGEAEINSPDTICQVYESFNIDDSTQIKDWHGKLGITKGKKICIIATKFINREAEQTLLKIIEEPSKDTHFFIIIPDTSLLLDTIISRTHVVRLDQTSDNEVRKLVSLFILSTRADRIKKIAEIIEKNKEKDNSGHLRYYATQFVSEIERLIYEKFKKNRNDAQVKFILNELQKSRKYLSVSGSSVKMILEHLALVI